MSAYETNLETIREIMADQSPAIQAEYQIDRLTSEVDSLCHIALHTPELLDRKSVGQLVTRVTLLMSFLMAKDAPCLKIVR